MLEAQEEALASFSTHLDMNSAQHHQPFLYATM